MFRSLATAAALQASLLARQSLSTVGFHDSSDFRKAMKELTDKAGKKATAIELVKHFKECSQTIINYLATKAKSNTLHLSASKPKEREAIAAACSELHGLVKQTALSHSSDSEKLIKCVEYATAALDKIRQAEEKAYTNNKKESLRNDLQNFVDTIKTHPCYNRATAYTAILKTRPSNDQHSGKDNKDNKATREIKIDSKSDEPSKTKKGKTGLWDIWRDIEGQYASYSGYDRENKRYVASPFSDEELSVYKKQLMEAEQANNESAGMKALNSYITAAGMKLSETTINSIQRPILETTIETIKSYPAYERLKALESELNSISTSQSQQGQQQSGAPEQTPSQQMVMR